MSSGAINVTPCGFGIGVGNGFKNGDPFLSPLPTPIPTPQGVRFQAVSEVLPGAITP